MSSFTATTCINWTSGYSWQTGEQACSTSSDNTMYACLNPSLCKRMDPYATDVFTNLKALDASITETTLVGTTNSGSVWKNRETGIAKYDPTDPVNCFTNWEQGKIYPKGATLCDGIIYQCEDTKNCGVYVPGSTEGELYWSELTSLSVPSSQEKTYEYYTKTTQYDYGDFAISRIDQQVYKCVNSSAECSNNGPGNNTYWQILVVKALNPSGIDTQVYTDWESYYRYQAGDLISDSSTDSVYECVLESFCQYSPTEDPLGAYGWDLTFYRVPDSASSKIPSTFYYTNGAAHMWI